MKGHPHESPHYPHWPLASLLFFFVFLLGLFSVHESATWMHIKTGARIVENRVIPATDPFSYTVSDKPWTTDSWLSDVLFFQIHRRLGPRGLIGFKSAVIAAAFALLLPLNPGSPIIAAAVLGLAAAAGWAGLTEIPGIFDLLMAALMIRVLRPRRKFAWSAVAKVAAIELLWANLHGPIAVFGLWLVGLKVFKTMLRSETGERAGYAAMLAACVVALLVNPAGWEIFPRLFGPVRAGAGDWPAGAFYILMAALGALACWICLQQEFFLSLCAASLLGLSVLFPSLRTLALLCACPVITLAVGHFIHPLSDTPARIARWTLAMAACFAVYWNYVYLPHGRARGYGTPALDGVIHFLQANAVTGRMFNDVQAGDALIGGSGRPVFVDGRAALYGPAFMKDAALWPARWSSLDEIYRFDYAVILNRRGGYPAKVFDREPWRLAYADDAALVYLKKSGADGWLAGRPRGALEPNRLWPDSLDARLAEPRRASKIFEELDRWIVQSPDSAQALLWKAYALDRLKLAEKAQRLITLAQTRPSLTWDPELLACLAFVREHRGDRAVAHKLYRRVAQSARRSGDVALEAAVLARLAPLTKEAGEEWEVRGIEERVKELATKTAVDDE